MSGQIEAGARALWDHGANTGTWGWSQVLEDTRKRYRAEAQAVWDAFHPTITTAEALDALPMGSAIVDEYGDVGQKLGNLWHFPETAPMGSSKVIRYGTATVLHMGGQP